MSNTQKDTQGSIPIRKHFVGLWRWVDHIEAFVLATSTAFLAILLIINVISRNIGKSIYFAEEISKLFIILITFTGSSYAARKARHIRMGAILELFPAKIEKVIVIIVSFISALVMFVLAYYSFRYMNELRIRETTTPALGAPYWYFIIIAPIMLCTSGIQFLRTVLKNFQEKDVWLSPEQQSEFEDEQTMIEGVLAEDDGANWKLKETT